MSEHSVEEVRAKFEAWAVSNGFFITKDERGNYESGYMSCGWGAFQAAYAERI